MEEHLKHIERLSLLKRTFFVLEKLQAELAHYELLSSSDLIPNHMISANGHTLTPSAVSFEKRTIDGKHSSPDEDISEITDIERVLNQRMLAIEQHFKTEDHAEEIHQLPLLKRALLAISRIQAALNRYKQATTTDEQDSIPSEHSPENLFALDAEVRISEEKGTSCIHSSSIPQSSARHEAPLSFTQQRLWFLEQLDPGKTVYNERSALRLKGKLHHDALERSFNEILRRHEILRTTFIPVDGGAVQHSKPWYPMRVVLVDLRGFAAATAEVQVKQLAEEGVQQPFDLISGPLWNVHVFRLTENEHLLLITFHHTVGDGWSMGILYHELAVLYAAFCDGRPSPLTELPIQYADYAVWQHQHLQGDALKTHLVYWEKQLADAPPLLELPTDHSRPGMPTHRGTHYSFVLPVLLTNALKDLSRREDVTLFMTLLATFQVLLYRYTHQEDILIGTSIANRNNAETEALIGFFANTLVLRGNMAHNPTFLDIVKQVRTTTLEAYNHQDMPFEQLVAALQPARNLTYSPLFQVMFVMQRASWFDSDLPGLQTTAVEIERGKAAFDLVLSIVEDEHSLRGYLEYNTDLFECVTMVRFIELWQTLLAGVIADPQQRIDMLPLLPLQERERLLIEWNKTWIAYEQQPCFHTLFESQVTSTADAVAMTFEDQQLTYTQVNQRANQLAHYLCAHGVGPEKLVGLCVDRSLEMVIGILAILKAGGAYVPLDPTYPQERLAWMLEDAQVTALLSQQGLNTDGFTYTIFLDEAWSTFARESVENPQLPLDVKNLAYIIYTSGSTGRPKGVQVSHYGLANLIEAQRYSFGIQASDHILQFSSISFDASLWEICMALSNGARLCLGPAKTLLPGRSLIELMQQQQITFVTFPPSVLAILSPQEWSGVDTIIVAGEACSAELVERWAGRRNFYNAYGPTEATIWSTIARCVPGRPQPPIGRPILRSQVYVLDKHEQPVPVGVLGEIYIGGVGLARGYLGRPELTAERFVPHPFSNEPGGRLYRSGDIGRYNADGELQFVGRIDQQVKIRGYRIELGEIEGVILQHSTVQECVVIVREDQPAEKRLVAYIVIRKQSAFSTSELRHFLKEQLPQYMLPSAFVRMEALPLNPNGKVDRRLLPIPEIARPELTEEYLVPQTETQLCIATLWQEVLQIDRVGLQDNFFDLGGHSLSMVKVHRKLQSTLKSDLLLLDLFKYPTISSLSAFINRANDSPLYKRQREVSQMSEQREKRPPTLSAPDIAIVGMAGRFPGADTVDEFWQCLLDGREMISFFSPEELLAAGVEPALAQDSRYVNAGAVLKDVAWFDAAFFGYSPREAEIIDPQQRLFLECCWHALENAGYNPETYTGLIGVFAGSSMNTYMASLLQAKHAFGGSLNNYQLVLGNGSDFLTTRVSYKLNLRGPSIVIQTACSTSLVAVHMACESLRSGECDMALAGGVSVRLPQKAGYLYEEGSVMSPDGHCRAFDVNAQGIVGGEGVGTVVLKRLVDAQDDNDTILAVIKGSAVNNDGAMKVGYTAPAVQGQAEVIARALAMAQIEPDTVSYVEAHGTGTPLGDPIEIDALRQAYGAESAYGQCAIGSVKTNIGHLDAAAGIAGLIKTILALRHRVVPPTLHFTAPNPALDLANSPFYVNTIPTKWETGDLSRRAGVSSFGIGGSNAHILLEEAPPLAGAATSPTRPYQVLMLSARSEAALHQLRLALYAHLQQHSDLELADVAYTMNVGRVQFNHRLVMVCSNLTDALQTLDPTSARQPQGSLLETPSRPVAFLFPGQGAQYLHMAWNLYQHEAVFREELDRCVALLIPLLHLDLRHVLYPSSEQAEEAAQQLVQTRVTQPALFVIEYALAKLWMAWGVYPSALIGHSIGEYVAACLSGVFSLETALQLVAIRGRLMQQLPSGAMLAVSLSEQEVQPRLGTQLSLAAINAPSQCVVSGPTAAVEELQQQLLVHGIECQHLHTSHAFHSLMVEAIMEEFAACMKTIQLQPPQIPYLSNVTGKWITASQATDPHYWVQHLRQTVRFAAAVQELLREESNWAFIEVGPGRSLSSFVKQQRQQDTATHITIPSLRRVTEKTSDSAFLLTSLGRLWLAGIPIKWQGFYMHEHRQRIPLPPYPFERQRYWIEPSPTRGLSFEQENSDDGALASVPVQKSPLPSTATMNGSVTFHPRPFLPAAYIAPRNELEQQIATIWQQLLGIDRVGINDNFFDLGGHSLLATQIMSRLRTALQIDVPLRHLFEAMTIAELARQIEALLQTIQQQETPSVAPVARSGGFTLSFAQQRLWLLDRLEPDNPLHNIAVALLLRGPLNTRILEQSLQEIVRRQEALRTFFTEVDGLPKQFIMPALSVPLPVMHLQTLSPDVQKREISRLTQSEAKQPFYLGQVPLLRTTLLCLSASQEHILLLTMHHVISDGWSMGIFIRELTTLYTASVNGQMSPLAELPIQYADFAVQQREMLQDALLEHHLDYWRNKLRGPLPMLDLSLDFPRPASQAYHGARQGLRLPASLAHGLKGLSQREGVTLFMTFLAAFQLLLARYTAQEDILVGTPIANRDRADIENIIGFFVDTLVLRTDLSGNPTFSELLSRVREICLEAYAHQAIPSEKLVEELRPPRNGSRSPFAQVLLRLPNTPTAPLAMAELTLSLLPVEVETADLDLTLDIIELPDTIEASIEYNANLFRPDTIARLLGHWQTVLEAIVELPHLRLAEVPLLTVAERQQLLKEWNADWKDYRSPSLLPSLFEAQVVRSPDALAVVFEQSQLSYAGLNRWANQIAHFLRKRGVGPEVLVGVCVEHSLEMVVSLLAIFKAGGVYVPLDPAYPEDRLAFMLDDAHIAVLIVQKHLTDVLPAQMTCPKVILDNGWSAFAEESVENPDLTIDAQNVAYVIYTSGSTGRPKGVQVPHYGLSNLIEAQRRTFRVQMTDHILQFSSISFDASIWEVVMALGNGARLCLSRAEILLPGPALADLIATQHITIVTLPPPVLAVLTPNDYKVIDTIIVAGEACSSDLVRHWAEGRKFFNAYGPTEGTVCATIARCEPGQPSPPIGHPITRTQVYILDPSGRTLPVGVIGEISIGGVGLARGYLNKPELTATRFVPHPFSTEPGARLYRTGDLGRYRPDGEIEFFGRVDQQVKLRGYRIELGEIETVLRQFSTVQDCVVVVRADQADDKRLVAYVVESDTLAQIDAMREYLKTRLPDYMVPGSFVSVDAFPLTANGKIDRSALPVPYLPASGSEESYVMPRNVVEELLVDIYKEVLDVEQIGIYDNFFELGGHSLLLTQVVARIRTSFGIELPIFSLFTAPTIAMQAEQVKEALSAGEGVAFPPITPVTREGKLPLSFAQQRIWFLDQLQPGNPSYAICAAFCLHTLLHVEMLEKSLQEIVCRHEALRTTFALMEDEPVQIVAPAWHLELPSIDLRNLSKTVQDAEVHHQANLKYRRPFDLSQGPLLRTSLLRLGTEEHILLCTFHNSVADGESREIFIRELSTLYEAFAAGKPLPLSPLAIQYVDFASWQRQWLQGEALRVQTSYWQQQLAGVPPVLELPLDRPRPAISIHSKGKRQSVSFPASLTTELKTLSLREGVTLFMTLLASFQTLLYRYCGQEDIVIGMPIANRVLVELESLIGFFANTLVLRTNLSGNPPFQELLERVRTVALGAYNHQALPFEKLVEIIQPVRNLSYAPLIQAMFTLQRESALMREHSWLTPFPLEVESRAAKFDLNLFLLDDERTLTGVIEYNADLFDDTTIQRLIQHWQRLLEGIVATPHERLAHFPILSTEERQHLIERTNSVDVDYTHLSLLFQPADRRVWEKTTPGTSPDQETKQAEQQAGRLIISATFTAEPLEEGLAFWMQEFDWPLHIEFAPYQQLFQQLLDPTSLLSCNQRGINVLVVRFEDWLRAEAVFSDTADGAPQGDGISRSHWYEKIERSVQELLLAIQGAVQRASIPYLLCLCPPSPFVAADEKHLAFIQQMETFLAEETGSLSGLSVVTSVDLADLYPVSLSYDAVGDTVGHVPYTPEFFAALSTMIARKVFALNSAPYKVIAIDCDNTLWKGMCGEDGVHGVAFDPPYLALQQFLIVQQKAGMLICLCSKNNMEDVFAVFDQRSEMTLQREHLVSWRINWRSKSENLADLAQEVQLGLESFIFIDDNPLECAEVEAQYPQVLTLLLPFNPHELPNFLKHVWGFDHLHLTEEDRNRTILYQREVARTRFQQEALTLKDFIDSLELAISFRPLDATNSARTLQLTQRTNQFNCTTVRYSPGEIEDYVRVEHHYCLLVDVCDRFGDYGMVGAILYKAHMDAIEVDTFLLSCRALGRGVEHRMLAKLGAIAQERGSGRVIVPYIPTPRNKPALDFLERVGAPYKREGSRDGWVFEFPVVHLLNLVYTPSSVPETDEQNEPEREPVLPAQKVISGHTPRDTRRLLRIAHDLATPEQVLAVLSSHKRQHPSLPEQLMLPRTQTEKRVAALWMQLLHLELVGVNDNFFALGGHSLLATQLLSRIAMTFEVKLPLLTVFEAPTIAELAEHIESSQRLTQNTHSTSIIVAGTQSQKVPLSYAQQRLWVLHEMAPRNPSYNIPLRIRLQGLLNAQVLQKSLVEIIRRHEILRTTLHSEDGQVVQTVSPSLSLSLMNLDLHSLTEAERTSEVTQLLKEEHLQIFDLARGPLVRATLLRTGDREHILALTFHHIVFDAWSTGVMNHELVTLYEAFSHQRPSSLVELPIQYADFALWQRQWLHGDVLQRLIDYWRKQLHGAVPLTLPNEYPHTVQRTFSGSSESISLSVSLSEALAALSRQEGVTLFMTLLAAFQTLLYRSTGQEDIVVGTDIANRTRVETEILIGFFVNLLVLRTNLAGKPSFREVLRRVREVVLAADAHQDLPFELLVDALHLKRKSGWSPLVRALFVVQNTPLEPLQLPGITITPVEAELDTVNFDLVIFLHEEQQALKGTIHYSNDIFDQRTIQEFVARFIVLLQSSVAQPDVSIDALEIYSEAERKQRIYEETVEHETLRRKLKTARRESIVLSDQDQWL